MKLKHNFSTLLIKFKNKIILIYNKKRNNNQLNKKIKIKYQNKNILIKIFLNFKWLTLYQIQQLV
jgi:hypothetical protein